VKEESPQWHLAVGQIITYSQQAAISHLFLFTCRFYLFFYTFATMFYGTPPVLQENHNLFSLFNLTILAVILF
jgi:hypothetical protein